MHRRKRFLAIVICTAILIPIFIGARARLLRHHRDRANSCRSACVGNLRLIESAKDNYCIDYGGTNGQQLTWDNLCYYMKDLTNKCFCPAALSNLRGPTNYAMNAIGVDAACLVIGAAGGHTTTNK